HGVAEMDVSSDLNTADHNSPTNFNNTIFVKGTVADAEGASTDVNRPPFPQVALSAPIGTWFRDSNLTQYGGHAHIDMKGVTGSECTGQAAGAAGLLMSYGKQRGTPLTANEVKQILTLTAEDVLPGDTLGTGDPHRADELHAVRDGLEPEPRRLRRRHLPAAPPGGAPHEPEPGRRHGRLPARHRLLRSALGPGRAGAGERPLEPVRFHRPPPRPGRRRPELSHDAARSALQPRRGPQG